MKGAKLSFLTPAGSVTPLWNALDREHQVLYVYAIHCIAGKIRGPYCHQKRTGYLYLLSGEVNISWRPYNPNEPLPFNIDTLKYSKEHIQRIVLPKLVEYFIEPLEDSLLLNICDYPWIETEPNETILRPKS